MPVEAAALADADGFDEAVCLSPFPQLDAVIAAKQAAMDMKRDIWCFIQTSKGTFSSNASVDLYGRVYLARALDGAVDVYLDLHSMERSTFTVDRRGPKVERLVTRKRSCMSSRLERTLPRNAYVSEKFFTQEKERLFFGEWFCVGRAEEAPDPGDYVVVDVAGESMLLVRGKDGELRAFFNVCRHRGSQLVMATERASGRFGNTVRCPYHSWTYDLDGRLRTAPFLEDGEDLCKADLPLHSAAIDTWGGFVFVRVSRDAGGSLSEQLGPIPDRLARYPLSELRIARRIAYTIDANWKCMLENYNECYHCGPVHPELCNLVPAFKQRGGAELDWERGIPHRDGAFTFTMSGTTERQPFAALNDDERTRHKGELIYPNLLLSLSADHVASFTVWPHAPARTTILCDFLFHPDEMSRPGFDPADAVDFWDLVNRQDWKICESVQRGMTSRVFQYGFYAPMESASLDIRRYIAERMDVT